MGGCKESVTVFTPFSESVYGLSTFLKRSLISYDVFVKGVYLLMRHSHWRRLTLVWTILGVIVVGKVLFICYFSVDLHSCLAQYQVTTLVTILSEWYDTMFYVMLRTFSVCTREQCALLGMIWWSISNRRNKWVWERANGSVLELELQLQICWGIVEQHKWMWK